MHKYTQQERVEIVTILIGNKRSITVTRRKLSKKYPNHSYKNTIYRLHSNFLQHSTTADMPRFRRQRTSRNAETVTMV